VSKKGGEDHMVKTRILLAVVSLFIASSTMANDKSDILALITKWNDLSNKGDEPGMAATCAKDAVVVDDPPPYLWRGAEACAEWQKSADTFVKNEGMTEIVGGVGKPSYVLIMADQAYVVIPATFAYTQRGKKLIESATATFTLQKTGVSWLITSWVWSKLAIRPAPAKPGS
jgi:ketosteroid isomerase-like protein